jgi:uncharacterized caspase-like protein
MVQKALTRRPGIGRTVFRTPLTARQTRPEPPARSGSAVSACLSAQDDFEFGREFLDVFTRASGRVAGFAIGSTVIGIAWLTVSFF